MSVRCHKCGGRTKYVARIVKGTEDRRCVKCGHTCEYNLVPWGQIIVVAIIAAVVGAQALDYIDLTTIEIGRVTGDAP